MACALLCLCHGQINKMARIYNLKSENLNSPPCLLALMFTHCLYLIVPLHKDNCSVRKFPT